MKGQHMIKQAIEVAEHLNPQALLAAGATNLRLSSTRTVRIDLPDGKAKDGINRIKITNMGDGKYRMQLLRIEEVDVVGGILPEKLNDVLAAFTGIGA